MSSKLSICNIIKKYTKNYTKNNNYIEYLTYIFNIEYEEKNIVEIIIKKININNSSFKKIDNNNLLANQYIKSFTEKDYIDFIQKNINKDKLLIEKIINNTSISLFTEKINNNRSSSGMMTKIKKNETNYGSYNIELNNDHKIIYFKISKKLFDNFLNKLIIKKTIKFKLKDISNILKIDDIYKNFMVYYKKKYKYYIEKNNLITFNFNVVT